MKFNKMKLGVILLMISFSVGIFSCKKKGCTDPTAVNYNSNAEKDDGSCEAAIVVTNTNTIKSGFISSNETWTSTQVYELNGKVVVQSGVTLTIESGTIIKGAEGTGANASAFEL